MQRSCYSIAKHRDRWLVSACGQDVLLCESKKTALKIVRQASDALYADHDAVPQDDRARRSIAGDSPDEAPLQQEAAG